MELPDDLLAIQKFMSDCNFELEYDDNYFLASWNKPITLGQWDHGDPRPKEFISAKCRKYGTTNGNVYLAIDDGILKLKVVGTGRSIGATEPCFTCALADPSCFSKLKKILAEL